MRGDDDVFRTNRAAGGDGCAGHQLEDLGVFIDGQTLRYGGEKFERVELGLPGKAHRTGGALFAGNQQGAL